MEYVLGLKKEIGLLNENEAKKRYLELLSMGYSEQDIVFATPVSVQVYLNVGQSTVATASTNHNDVNRRDQEVRNGFTDNTMYLNVAGINTEGDELPSDTIS